MFPMVQHFHIGETFTLCKIAQSPELKKHMYHLEQYHQCYKQECLPQCFPVRIELACRRNTPYLPACSSGRNIHFRKNNLIQVNWRLCVSLGRKPFMLEAGVCCTLFPYENWVSMWKECSLSVSVFNGRNSHFLQNNPIQLNWRNTCISWNNTLCVRSSSLVHCLLRRTELACERNTTCQCFQVGEIFTSWKIPLFIWITESCISPGRMQ
jgi:hypothetical protein